VFLVSVPTLLIASRSQGCVFSSHVSLAGQVLTGTADLLLLLAGSEELGELGLLEVAQARLLATAATIMVLATGVPGGRQAARCAGARPT
jgi:hypothetical protein